MFRDMDGSAAVNALAQVDEVYRAPLAMFYLEDLSYKEISEALDVPIGTVMSRLSRGKAQLRQHLLEAHENAARKVVPLEPEAKSNVP
jgi:RNA polymerase sigma-70 factor, ECF subfamily